MTPQNPDHLCVYDDAPTDACDDHARDDDGAESDGNGSCDDENALRKTKKKIIILK